MKCMSIDKFKDFDYYYYNIKRNFNVILNEYDWIDMLTYIENNNIEIKEVDKYLNINCNDCEYCCMCYECKNCYNCRNCKNCKYSRECSKCKDCNNVIACNDSVLRTFRKLSVFVY